MNLTPTELEVLYTEIPELNGQASEKLQTALVKLNEHIADKTSLDYQVLKALFV